MPKANLTLPDGTVVTIDGSTQEVAKLLRTFSSTDRFSREKRSRSSRGKREPSAKATPRKRQGPTAYVLELRDEGFFKGKRYLNEIQKKLEERGHIYARTTLSPVLLGLVKKRELRRIKEKKGWAYVH